MGKFIIKGGRTLSGKVKISGAKNSALKIIAASILADSKTTLGNIPDIEDVSTMIEVLKTLGAKAKADKKENTLEIDPSGINSFEAPYELVRKMRASILVTGPLLARFGEVKVAIPGGCNIGSRQIDMHLKGFEDMGASYNVEHGYINCRAKNNGPGARLKGAKINLDFPSRGATENIMMAASLASGRTVVNNAAREPEITDLAKFLNLMGADIKGAGTDCITINGVKNMKGTEYEVMPDSIEAGTFATVASLCGDGVEIENAAWMNLETFYLKLKEIGVKIEMVDDNNIKISSDRAQYRPANISTLPHPGFPTDLQPLITVLLSVVRGISIITENVFENRFMYADELNRMGANIKIDGHHAVLKGVDKLSGAPVTAFDLRAGAAVVIAGLIAEGTTEVSDIYHIQRGYEGFEKKLKKLGADIKRVN